MPVRALSSAARAPRTQTSDDELAIRFDRAAAGVAGLPAGHAARALHKDLGDLHQRILAKSGSVDAYLQEPVSPAEHAARTEKVALLAVGLDAVADGRIDAREALDLAVRVNRIARLDGTNGGTNGGSNDGTNGGTRSGPTNDPRAAARDAANRDASRRQDARLLERRLLERRLFERLENRRRD